ncbi:MAG: penicillin-binding protein 2, partial [Anaerolineae bacterium]|nr:penicillin-binding protein 2 [Anaerolineae bacterium]
LPAARGIIYSRNGETLVRNAPMFEIAIVPALLPDEEEDEERVLRRLAELIDVPYADIRETLDGAIDLGYYYDAVPVALRVDRERALLVAQENLTLPGTQVVVTSRRQYPYGSLISQLLGYLGAIPEAFADEYVEEGYDPATDRIGYAGVEAGLEEWLRGIPGQRYQEEDVYGRPIRILGEEIVPIPGHNVYLTIDLALQQVAQDALSSAMARYGSPRGVAIAMDPRTGEILAMVSLPSYDNNLFAQGISQDDLNRLYENPHRPLINHAIADNLPPGSIFKIIPATAALQEGVLTPRTRLDCPGRIELPNRYYPNDPAMAQPFYCWLRSGHGYNDIVGGLAYSCDIFFYKVGGGFEDDNFEGLGADTMARYARLFGLGSVTGIEMPGESAGLVPDPAWKRQTIGENWTTGNTYDMAIGQSYLQVTPLQMLNVLATTANGGTLYRPQIVHHITDYAGNVVRPFEPVISHTLPISPEHWSVIQAGLEGAVVYGTAPNAQVEGVRVAGKTGTAQYCDDIALGLGICGEGLAMPTHAWFMAFAPVEAPEIAVIAFVYNGGEGSTAAVPVVQDILEWYFHHDDPPPEDAQAP